MCLVPMLRLESPTGIRARDCTCSKPQLFAPRLQMLSVPIGACRSCRANALAYTSHQATAHPWDTGPAKSFSDRSNGKDHSDVQTICPAALSCISHPFCVIRWLKLMVD